MYSRTVVLDDVDVLVDGVGGALIPLRLRDALAGRQDVEALVALGAQEVPAALQVADQRVRLVLRGDADAADAGIERVGQREIDDARLAAEIDRGLGAPVGQFHRAGCRVRRPAHRPSRRGPAAMVSGSLPCSPSLLIARINPGRISRSASPAAAGRDRRRPASSRPSACCATTLPWLPDVRCRHTSRRRC